MRRTVTNGSAATHSAALRFDYASLAHDVRIEVGAQAAAIRELNGEPLAVLDTNPKRQPGSDLAPALATNDEEGEDQDETRDVSVCGAGVPPAVVSLEAAGETPAPQLQPASTPLAAGRASPLAVQPVAHATPSRRTFLASIGLALAALVGQRSIASAGPSAPLPARNGLPPPGSSPDGRGKPAGDAQRQIVRRVGTLENISTKSNSSGQIVQTTYTYAFSESVPISCLK